MSNAPQNISPPSFLELFTPKLVTVLREGYGAKALRADISAGLTVAVVALPLSMAIAIASGTTPDRGLVSAIIGGFLVSLLGGSRFQIGGPAGAFIVLVAAAVSRHGIDGLVLATFLSGLFLIAIGYLRLGTYVKFIPYPVTIGFSSGIACIIFLSQLRDALGIPSEEGAHGNIFQQLSSLSSSLPSSSPQAFFTAVATIALIVVVKRFKPGWPSMLIAVAVTSALAALSDMSVVTIGERFGGIPRSLPLPALPPLSLEKVYSVLPDAIGFTLLGAIESLLSAVVADGMTGRRHRSNCELVAQGFANVGASLFGGICVTGTIARTATNVRAGAHGPISGMMHSLFLLLFMLLAAPLASYIPLASLAGVLILVSYHMIEKHALAALIRSSRGDMLVVLATLILTVFYGLIEGIVVGVALGSILFIERLAKTVLVNEQSDLVLRDIPDSAISESEASIQPTPAMPDTVVYRISGVIFFGAASTVSSVLDRIADQRKNFVLDFSTVPLIDSTGATVIAGAARKAHNAGRRFIVAGASEEIEKLLRTHGVVPPLAEYRESLADVWQSSVPSPDKSA